MIRRWLALTYYLYALRLAALSHFYFNRLYLAARHAQNKPPAPFNKGRRFFYDCQNSHRQRPLQNLSFASQSAWRRKESQTIQRDTVKGGSPAVPPAQRQPEFTSPASGAASNRENSSHGTPPTSAPPQSAQL